MKTGRKEASKCLNIGDVQRKERKEKHVIYISRIIHGKYTRKIRVIVKPREYYSCVRMDK